MNIALFQMNPMNFSSANGFFSSFLSKVLTCDWIEMTAFILSIALETHHAIAGLCGLQLEICD